MNKQNSINYFLVMIRFIFNNNKKLLQLINNILLNIID